MARHVWPFTTPIVREAVSGQVQSHGSGSYLTLHGANYLLTNEHVITDANGDRIFHLPGPTDDFFPLAETIYQDPWPVDAALARMGMEWTGTGKSSINSTLFDHAFSAVDKELLFFLGYPGSTAPRTAIGASSAEIRHSMFGYIRDLPGIPFVTQKEPTVEPLEFFDPSYHLMFHYPERAYPSRDAQPVPILYPGGISGTLLWDTKYLACRAAGQEWSPDRARVCGLICRDARERRLMMATKIEFVRPLLLHWIRKERAFLNWLDREKPLWESSVDWNWSEGQFPDL